MPTACWRCTPTPPLKADRLRRVLPEITRGVGADVISTVIGNGVGASAALVASVILARWLGPTNRGAFELGLFAANSALLVLCLGLNLPVSVFATKEPAKGIWAYRFGLYLLAAFLAIALIAVAVLHGETGNILGWLVVFAGLFLSQLTNALLIGTGRIRRLNVGGAVRWLVYLGGLAAFAKLLSPDVGLALGWYAFALLVTAGIAWHGLRGLHRDAALTPLSAGVRRSVVWFGVRGQISNILQFVSYRFDVLLVGLWVGAAGLGVYAVGVMFAEALWLIPNALGTVLLSHTSRSETAAADRRIRVVFPVAMMIVLAIAGVLSLASPLIAGGYLGPGYHQVPVVTWVLMPGAIALSGSKILANELTARGYPGTNTLAAACGAITTVGVDLLLIPRFGIVGASVASSIGYAATFVFTLSAFRRRAGVALLWA